MTVVSPAPSLKRMSDSKETPVEQLEMSFEEDQAVPHLHAKTILVVFAVVLIYFAQIVAIASAGAYSSVVAAEIGGADRASWMVTSITLPITVLTAPLSQAADYWGRRWFLIVTTALGFVGGMITSRATSMGVAIVGQTFIGLSSSSISLLFAVASEVLPHRHRMSGQVSLTISSGVGGISGLMVGAALITKFGPSGFRILWYIIAGTFAIATIICVVYYRPPPRELEISLTHKEKLARLDWVGYFLFDVGLILICMGLSWAMNPYPWNSPQVLVLVLLGFAFLGGFGVYEWKGRVDGILDHRLFARGRNFPLALIEIFVDGLTFIACNNYIPFQVSVLYDSRPVFIGLNFSILFIAGFISSLLAAFYCYQFKRLRIVMVVSFILFVVFGICMATTTLGSGTAIWVFPAIAGVALALTVSGLVAIAQFSAPPELIAQASGLLAATRGLGATVGSAVYIAIFSSRIGILLPDRVAAAALAAGLPESSVPALIQDLVAHATDALSEIPGITADIINASVAALLSAYLDSFRYIWIVLTAIAAAGLILSYFFVDEKADFNQKIDAPAESEEALYGKQRA